MVYFILLYFSLFLTGHFSSVQDLNIFVTTALCFIFITHCNFPFFFKYENQYNLMYKPKEVDFTNYIQHNSKIRIFVHISICFFRMFLVDLYCFLLWFLIIKDAESEQTELKRYRRLPLGTVGLSKNTETYIKMKTEICTDINYMNEIVCIKRYICINIF